MRSTWAHTFFNLSQAESIVDILNEYLENPLSAISLLKFLNDEADCFESMKLEAKEKKQRYVIIIVNALASTLWTHKELQDRFIEKCRIRISIDKATWDSQTSRIRNASAGGRTVSLKALQLRDELYEQLGIPSEFRLWDKLPTMLPKISKFVRKSLIFKEIIIYQYPSHCQ